MVDLVVQKFQLLYGSGCGVVRAWTGKRMHVLVLQLGLCTLNTSAMLFFSTANLLENRKAISSLLDSTAVTTFRRPLTTHVAFSIA